MTDARRVDYQFNAVDMTNLMINVGKNDKEVYRALGYLSTWNFSYPIVKIWIDAKHCEINAAFFDTDDGDCRYSIGAVWHDDHFGFHS
jgi:hypothetical protein